MKLQMKTLSKRFHIAGKGADVGGRVVETGHGRRVLFGHLRDLFNIHHPVRTGLAVHTGTIRSRLEYGIRQRGFEH